MAETFTDKLKLSKRDTGDLNWGQGANANLDALDAHVQQAFLRPPRTAIATLGSGAVGANLSGNTAYFYKVTAINGAGETTEGKIPAVVEAQVTQPTTPLPVIIQWEIVKGATGYKIYKSTATGQEKFLASVTGESTVAYTDTGNTATNPAISVPTTNTASVAGSNEHVIFNDAGTISGNDKLKFTKASGLLSLTGQIKIVDGLQSSGKVLTSDADGLAAWQAPSGGGGVTDHGALTGLADDDHPQYQLKGVLTTKGDLYARDASGIVRLGAGSDGQVLTADAASAAGMKWAAASGGGGASPGWVLVEKVIMAGETYTFSGLAAGIREYKMIIDTYANNQANYNIFLNGQSSYNYAKKTSVSLGSGDTAYAFSTTFNALITIGNPAHMECLLAFIYNSAQNVFDVNVHSVITEKAYYGKTANEYVFYKTSASAATEVTSITINAYAGVKVILLKLV